MLERVPLLEKHLDDYARRRRARDASTGSGRWPSRSQGARVLHVNATAYGGGVAELLATHVAAAARRRHRRRVAGDPRQRRVLRASPRRCTTRCRAPTSSGRTQMERIYLETRARQRAAARRRVGLRRHPRPAARRDARATCAARRRSTPETRSGSGAATSTSPTRTRRCGSSSARSSSSTTRRCGRCREFVPDVARRWTASCIAPPCIDPLSVKNLELPTPFVEEIMQAVRRRRAPARSSCQVSRFDPWKDPIGVIEAFRIVRERVPDAQLVLAGSMATDDPEGFHSGSSPTRRAPATATSTCCRTSSRSATVQINAFQRVGRRRDAEVAARGLRPHRERRRCGRAGPSSAAAAAASRCRSDDGVERLPRRLRRGVRAAHRRPARATRPAPTRWARTGREHVRSNFLSTRELEDWLRLFGDLRLTRSDRRLAPRARTGSRASDDGDVRRAPRRGRRRRARSRPLLAATTDDATWIAAAMSRRRPRRGRGRARPRVSGIDLRAARPRSRAAPHALRRRRRTACCGSCTTACSTSPAGRASTAASARRGTRTSR